MSRLILFVILILAIVVAAGAVASVFRQTPKPSSGGAPGGAIPKVAFGLLMVVMLGVGSGWLGAE
ncbi:MULTISPECIES: hypothetical protein [Roseobacteraceae]|jgi:hypothetical protein|uniref:Uncharacterized protein n=1 Tax=Pseudosulfitobacter pseudonitzschiae TaxID=1402135 RepID=A0A221JXH8_9RHOB|nr:MULTISPECIES: hypothetical protein [Roseobacteraceae]ASM71445.1 hypothetical protein SULPSESMR1_00612 [Pseudosulfitobacter pseudonitzschiae]